MKGFLQRLFGNGPAPEKAARPQDTGRLEIKPFSHGLVRIPALDFFGLHAASSDGRFHLIWQDRNPEGTVGGHRYEGHGSWTLLTDEGQVLAKGRLERPQDGHLAENGTFILSDWMFGDGLNSRLVAFRVDGQKIVDRPFSANMASSGLSDDGRFAICQTANAPGSPDSCRYFLFDLDVGQEIASWEQEAGWAARYEFDTTNRCVYLIGNDDERVGHDFKGEMVDREGWQLRRIGAGDIEVMRSIVASQGGNPAPELRAAILAGLDAAVARGEAWQQARALRLRGELHEQAEEIDDAIAAYDKALSIDPQVGVSRKLAKLQRSKMPKGAKGATVKISRFEQQAQRLGIEHEVVQLEKGAGKEWRLRPTDAMNLVELAALDHYVAEGWTGAAAEGGLMLTLIKAASFDPLPPRHSDTFVEALYAQNVSFPEDRFDRDQLLESISRATRKQVERNWAIIAATAGETPAFYPGVRRDHVLGLFDCLGTTRLREIAKLFAEAPYDLRAGWPDLTLWRDGEIRFVEVKAPGDSMHASQARLISTILVPLGFRVGIAEIRPA